MDRVLGLAAKEPGPKAAWSVCAAEWVYLLYSRDTVTAKRRHIAMDVSALRSWRVAGHPTEISCGFGGSYRPAMRARPRASKPADQRRQKAGSSALQLRKST